MLEVQDLHAGYRESRVVQGANLTVPNGHVTALLGRNGAGKTTLVRAITGTIRPKGLIKLLGQDIVGLPPERIARAGIGLVPQGRGIFPPLTVLENLTLGRRPGAWTLERVYVLFPRLKERAHHFGNQLSGGEQQMVAIGRALLMNPRLLIMDEPSEGLAPKVVQEVQHVIRTLKQEGHSILLVEHNLPLTLSVADDIYILNKGQTVCQCTPEELAHDQTTKRVHLGV